MIPVDGSFPNLLEWPGLLALEAGEEQARGCCQSRAQCCGTLAGSPLSPGPAPAHEADTRNMLSV